MVKSVIKSALVSTQIYYNYNVSTTTELKSSSAGVHHLVVHAQCRPRPAHDQQSHRKWIEKTTKMTTAIILSWHTAASISCILNLGLKRLCEVKTVKCSLLNLYSISVSGPSIWNILLFHYLKELVLSLQTLLFKQEIWANAHETHESLRQFLFAGNFRLSPSFSSQVTLLQPKIAPKNHLKINIFRVQGHSRSSMMTFLKSLSPMLVIISSMSVPICNHFHIRRANSGRITSF